MNIIKKIGFYLFLIFAIILSCIGTVLIISFIQETIFFPKQYLLATCNFPFNFLSVFIVIVVGALVFCFIQSKRGINKGTYYERFPYYIKKFLIYIIVIFAILIYSMITSVNIFTKDEIIHHTYYNPSGVKYSYDDIVSVNAGFYGKKVLLSHYKGDFYYLIMLKDGTQINIMDILNEPGNDDAYSQIEYIDKIIMEKNVVKVSSLYSIEFSHLGQEYLNRFKRIIDNK